MTKVTSLDELWESTPPSQRTFELDQLAGLPDAARRYFEDARAPGTSLAGKFFRVEIDDARHR